MGIIALEGLLLKRTHVLKSVAMVGSRHQNNVMTTIQCQEMAVQIVFETQAILAALLEEALDHVTLFAMTQSRQEQSNATMETTITEMAAPQVAKLSQDGSVLLLSLPARQFAEMG